MSGLFGVGTSAMMAAYAQMRTASHNISNVGTPGFNRQEAVLSAVAGSQTGAGFIGRGVAVDSVVRRYDQQLALEVASSKSSAAADAVRAGQLARLEAVFSDGDTSLGTAIDDLRAAFADVVNRPGDPTARSVVLSRARTLVERFGSVTGRLDELRDQSDQKLRDGVSRINDALAQIATLNDQIARRGSMGQPPNDLLDRRDQLVETVNGQIRATSFVGPDGSVTLYAASGHALVVGTQASRLSIQGDSLDPRKLSLTLGSGASAVPIGSDTIGGGELAGALRFRDEDLEAAQARVGQLAAALAQAYNDRQALGRDASGAVGSPMFALGAPEVGPSSENTGNAKLAVTLLDGTAVAATDYELRFDGAAWSVTRLSDGVRSALGAMPAVLDGLRISVGAGAPAAGDRFLVRGASAFAGGLAMSLAGTQGLATGLAMTPQRLATNTGDVRSTAFTVTSNDANLLAPVTIQFTSATTFNVTGAGTGNPTGLAYTPGMPVSYNGWSMTLAGTAGATDRIDIVPTANPALDNRNARMMLDIGEQSIVGGRKPVDAFGDLLADMGIRSQSAQAAESLSSRTLAQAESDRAGISGVNLDEEAARLMQFQQAYQAAAKILTTAQNVFDTLLQIAR